MQIEENNIDPNKIHLIFIEEVEVEMADIPDTELSELKLSSNIAHISGYNIDEKKYFLGLQLIISAQGSSRTYELKFRYNFHFKIDNLENMYTSDKDGSVIFFRLFVSTLAGISYSTLRGIVYERTMKNLASNIVLPVINPSIILDSWIGKD